MVPYYTAYSKKQKSNISLLKPIVGYSSKKCRAVWGLKIRQENCGGVLKIKENVDRCRESKKCARGKSKNVGGGKI